MPISNLSSRFQPLNTQKIKSCNSKIILRPIAPIARLIFIIPQVLQTMVSMIISLEKGATHSIIQQYMSFIKNMV